MELDRKSLASFRVLVGVARADGSLADSEMAALKVALGERADLLPSLVAEDVDLDHEIGLLSPPERERVYQSAFALAHADGNASTFEVALLRKIMPNRGEDTVLGQVFGETLDTLVPGRIVAEADPVQRDSEITEDILKYSVLSAVAGAMPVPGVAIVADVAVIAIQGKMVHDIGEYFGHALDGPAVRAFLTSVAGSALMRIAANNLARFVPGWGSAFGAATSFASTYAIGRVAQQYFDADQGLDEDELKSLFESARAEGRKRYHAAKDQIDTAEVAHGKAIAELNEKLATGQITRADYDRALATLPLSPDASAWPDDDPSLSALAPAARHRVAAAAKYGFWALPLAFYGFTACRGVGWVDSGMIINTTWLFKTGAWVNVHNLFLVLARLWLLVVPVQSPAYALNLLAGVLGAVTVYLLFRTALLLTDNLLASVVAGVALTVSHSLWWHSTMVEVYTLNTALLGGMLFLLVRWNRFGARTDLYGSVFCFGLGVSNHVLMGLYLFAYLALFLIPAERRTLWRSKVFFAGVAAFLLGAQLWAMEFERAYVTELNHHPVAEQTAAVELEVLGDTLYTATGGRFHDSMFPDDDRGTSLRWHENYAFLFGYQYPSVAWPLGLLGLWAFARDRRYRTSFVFFAVGLATQALWSSNYFVWDMYAFGLPVWVMWGLLVAPGFDWLYRRGGQLRVGLLAALPTLAIGPFLYASMAGWQDLPAFLQLDVYRGSALYDSAEYVFDPNKRHYTRTEDVVAGLAATLPEGAHLIDSDAKGYYPFRMYAQRVLGLRPDVVTHLVFGAFMDDAKLTGIAKEAEDALDSGAPVFVIAVSKPERSVLARLERLLWPDAPPVPVLERMPAPQFVDQFPVYELRRVHLEGVDKAAIYQFVQRVPSDGATGE